MFRRTTQIGDPLTARQQDILGYMRQHLVDEQRLPTLRELMARFGIGSPNGVVVTLNAMVAKGRLLRGVKGTAGAYRLAGVRLTITDVEGQP